MSQQQAKVYAEQLLSQLYHSSSISSACMSLVNTLLHYSESSKVRIHLVRNCIVRRYLHNFLDLTSWHVCRSIQYHFGSDMCAWCCTHRWIVGWWCCHHSMERFRMAGALQSVRAEVLTLNSFYHGMSDTEFFSCDI